MEKERNMTIENPKGLHARAAAVFRECASKFSSEIFVIFGDRKTNAKSLLGLIAFGAAKGSVLTVTACGEDADEALDALEKLLKTIADED